MVEFPIFEEIKTFLYTNIEYILGIIAPVVTLILYLANKINARIESEQLEADELKKDLTKTLGNLQKDIDEIRKQNNKFELEIRLKIQAMEFSLQNYSQNVFSRREPKRQYSTKNRTRLREEREEEEDGREEI